MTQQDQTRRTPPRIPGYVLGAPAGFGAHGPVWSARTARGRPVLVSVLSLPRRGAELLRGLEALTRTRHPHLAAVLGAYPLEAGECAVVSEPVDGPTLATVVSARRRLPRPELAEVGRTVAGALAHLHERGVVHGDVSPATVLLAPGGVPVLAAPAGEVAAEQGTAGFVAPEREAGAPAGPAADVWALARVLRWCAGEDAELDDVLGPALAPDPRLRPAARELADAWAGLGPAAAVQVPTADLAQARLRAGRHRGPGATGSLARSVAGARSVTGARRRTPLLVLGAAVLAGMALGTAVVRPGGLAPAASVADGRPDAAHGARATVSDLLARRDAALLAGDAQALAEVTVPGSEVAAQDSRLLADLAESGVRLGGLRTELVGLEVVVEHTDRLVVDAVLVQQPHVRAGDGGQEQSVPGQATRCVRLVLDGPRPWRASAVGRCTLTG